MEMNVNVEDIFFELMRINKLTYCNSLGVFQAKMEGKDELYPKCNIVRLVPSVLQYQHTCVFQLAANPPGEWPN